MLSDGAGRRRSHCEDKLLCAADGRAIHAECWSHPLRRDGELFGAVITCIDITERRRVQDEVRGLNTALENAVEGIARLDVHGRYISVNPAYAAMLGYRPEELVNLDWQSTVHPEDVEIVARAHEQMVESGRALAEVRGIRRDHSVFWKECVLVKSENQKGEWTGNYCFMKDISEYKEAHEALRLYAMRSHELLRRVVEVQEKERRHLAGELHDEIGQVLSTISVNMHAVKALRQQAQPRIDESIHIVARAVQQVRNLSLDLRPSMLDDLGLAATVRWFADRQSQRGPEHALCGPVDGGSVAAGSRRRGLSRGSRGATNVVRHARCARFGSNFERETTGFTWRCATTEWASIPKPRRVAPCGREPGIAGDPGACRAGGRPRRNQITTRSGIDHSGVAAHGSTHTGPRAGEGTRAMNRPIQVLLADDHHLFRAGIRACSRTSQGSRLSPRRLTAARRFGCASHITPTSRSWTS